MFFSATQSIVGSRKYLILHTSTITFLLFYGNYDFIRCIFYYLDYVIAERRL